MDNSCIYLIGNILLYFIYLLYIQINKKQFSCSSLVVSYYLFSACCSYFFYTHPYTSQTFYYREISWQALLYFFILSSFIFFPLYNFDKVDKDSVVYVKEKPVILYMKVALFVQVVLIIGYLPAFFVMATSDMAIMRDDIGGGDISPNQYVAKIFAQIMFRYENFKLLSTIVAIYALFFIKKHRKLVLCFSFVSLIFPMYTSFLYLMRSQMFLQIIFVSSFLIMFKKQLSKKQKKVITIIGGSVVGLIAFVLITISQGRFDDLATWMYYKYSGETFVNFAGQLWSDAKGTTDGYAYFRWLIDDSDWVGLFEKWTYIENNVGVNSHIFYGSIGQLAIEFGWIVSALIHISIGLALSQLLKKKRYISLPNLIIIGFAIYFALYGFYIFPFQGTAIIQVFIIIIAYFYTRNIQIFNNVKL